MQRGREGKRRERKTIGIILRSITMMITMMMTHIMFEIKLTNKNQNKKRKKSIVYMKMKVS